MNEPTKLPNVSVVDEAFMKIQSHADSRAASEVIRAHIAHQRAVMEAMAKCIIQSCNHCDYFIPGMDTGHDKRCGNDKESPVLC